MERMKCLEDNSNRKSCEIFDKTTCLENLSNEIFYEIFDYLDGYTIFNSFSFLNQRFHRLLIDSSFLLKISLDAKTKLNMNYKTFLNLYRNRLISINFLDQSIVDEFTHFYTINSSFNHLESITIHDHTSIFRLVVLLFHFKTLPNLFSLNINVDDFQDNLGDIYQILFHISTLKSLKLTSLSTEPIDIDIPISYKKFSSIKSFVLNHCITLNQLIDILQYTIEIVHLNCSNIIEFEDEIISNKSIDLPNLKRLILNLNDVDFEKFREFLVKICVKLDYLVVKIESLDKSYLDGNLWEELISKEILHLKEFHFSFVDFIYDSIIDRFYSLINRFTSSFWIEHKWMFGISFKDIYMTYSILPLHKMKSDFDEHNCLSGAYLHIDSCLQILRNPSSNIIRTVLQSVNINRLNIRCIRITIEMFIKLLNLLPNLIAIRLIDLPSDDDIEKCQFVNSDDVQRFLMNNQIMKITLKNPTEIQINLILTYFTRLQSFAFEITSNIDLRSVIRCILTKSNLCQPIQICIFGQKSQFHDFQSFEQENFFNKYQIIQQSNRIFIQQSN